MIPAKGNAALPDAVSVRDNQIGRVGSHGKEDDRLRRIIGIEILQQRLLEAVKGNVVIEGKGRKLDEIDLDPSRLVGLDCAVHLFFLHCEQADFSFEREPFDLFSATAQGLIVPDDVIQIEGDLLACFVQDDFRNLLGFYRRELDESGKPVLARYRDGHSIAADVVARLELLQGFGNQFNWVSPRLGKDLGILDVVEGDRLDLLSVFAGTASKCFDPGVSNIDSPDGITFGHQTTPICPISVGFCGDKPPSCVAANPVADELARKDPMLEKCVAYPLLPRSSSYRRIFHYVNKMVWLPLIAVTI